MVKNHYRISDQKEHVGQLEVIRGSSRDARFKASYSLIPKIAYSPTGKARKLRVNLAAVGGHDLLKLLQGV